MGGVDDRVTYAVAAQILGCGVSNIPKLIRRGLLTSHSGRGKGPALDVYEVQELARQRARAVEEAELRRATSTTRTPSDPRPAPVDGTRWLTPDQAGEIIGVTGQAVRKRCHRGTIPHVRVGRQWWVREDHARLAAHVRATDGPSAVAGALGGVTAEGFEYV